MRVITIEGDTPTEYAESTRVAYEETKGLKPINMDLSNDIWEFVDANGETILIKWGVAPRSNLSMAESLELTLRVIKP